MADTGRPFGLLAELTHRCPLHCTYCSNPVELLTRDRELTTEQWQDTFDQARKLGVLQVHLSGGEPLLRRDLPELVRHASRLGCYVNLVTSGLGLTERRAAELAGCGLDHVQLSLQDASETEADRMAGTTAHRTKLAAARIVRDLGLPLTVNVVLHRGNLDRVQEICLLAKDLGAARLELANTQYYGWALRNRAGLLPSAGQLNRALETVRQMRRQLGESMQIVYVTADYYEPYPKPCMHGWAARQLTIAPDGTVLPCPAAQVIKDLSWPRVTDRSLADIWYHSEGFNAFRGTAWMSPTCTACPRKEIDFGGCRCQAYLLTGRAEATDPVCGKSPDHHLIEALVAAPGDAEPVMRGYR
ncbi:pyrroloquinoline quinone biosynthesis protein PqqE [Pseudonocardiaceae bacterium YIM PH 21723]|nr:pyrroloquinoline quinone biosynthesis protein PqqE [Pseudonocardiaceae bacterium YIM PH 21723]